MTIKDADGLEWVLVPVEATDEMVAAGRENANCAVRSAINAAIAAAPQSVPPVVTDQTCMNVVYALMSGGNSSRKGSAATGEEIIAAVQQVLGPTLGLAPQSIDVDWLSNVIRTVDGNHSLGAGTLAEKIVEAINARGVK